MSTSAVSNTKSTSKQAYKLLEACMYASLETYANVHRGSGPASVVTNHLYEKARYMVLDYLNLSKRKFVVIFGSRLHISHIKSCLAVGSFHEIASIDFGLCLGVRALVVRKHHLAKIKPGFVGGGTTKLYGSNWVMWANAPEKFEAGTPPIINCIAFARALMVIREKGADVFRHKTPETDSASKILYTNELESQKGEILLHALKKQWVGYGVEAPTIYGPRPFINLDNSATTPALAPVWQAYKKTLQQNERQQKTLINAVQNIVSDVFGAPMDKYDLIFTANTTEALNLVANSLDKMRSKNTESMIMGSVLEHSSNDLPWRKIQGHKLIRLSVDKAGFFDLDELENKLAVNNNPNADGKKSIKLVTLSGASNIIGTCNNLHAIGNITKRYGAQLLVDAAQLAAHRKIDMENTNIDYLAFSAHKTYAPFGTGMLIARKGLLAFDEKEMTEIKASGTENPGGIAALGKALMLLKQIGFEVIAAEEHTLLQKAVNGLAPVSAINIHGIPKVDKTKLEHQTALVAFHFNNKLNSGLARNLAHQAGIDTRFGCHCAHILLKYLLDFTPFQDKVQRLVLRLVPALNLQGVLRISFGLQNTEEDVEALLENLQKKGRLSSSQMNEFLNKRSKLVYG